MTIQALAIVLQALGYLMLGFSLFSFLVRNAAGLTVRNMLGALGMVVCATCVLTIGTNVMFQDKVKRVERRVEAVEKTHEMEERLSPLVSEIYQKIRDLQFRCDALEAGTVVTPDTFGEP